MSRGSPTPPEPPSSEKSESRSASVPDRQDFHSLLYAPVSYFNFLRLACVAFTTTSKITKTFFKSLMVSHDPESKPLTTVVWVLNNQSLQTHLLSAVPGETAKIWHVSCAPTFFCALYTGLLYPWCVIIIHMYHAHPYFSLRNLGKKVHIIHSKT